MCIRDRDDVETSPFQMDRQGQGILNTAWATLLLIATAVYTCFIMALHTLIERHSGRQANSSKNLKLF